jgi:gluconate 2-dehydrogenase gamma chain
VQTSGLRVLSAAEYFALAAVCERVYPRDESPGAQDLGIPTFIDAALARAGLPGWADGLLTALARLDAASLRRFGAAFGDARAADQEALLEAWAAEADGDNRQFIRNVVSAALEGALGDPTYGGNRGGAGWSSFGFQADPFAPSKPAKP